MTPFAFPLKTEHAGERMIGRQRWLWVACLLLSTVIPASCRAESDAAKAWLQGILARIEAHKPANARGLSGKATVKFVLDPSGKLLSKELVKSTGVPQLDAAVLKMVESSAPFPPPPAGLADLTFGLPVEFKAGQPVRR